eukprot:4874965-Prorocentrum_lima.AAC.1
MSKHHNTSDHKVYTTYNDNNATDKERARAHGKKRKAVEENGEVEGGCPKLRGGKGSKPQLTDHEASIGD